MSNFRLASATLLPKLDQLSAPRPRCSMLHAVAAATGPPEVATLAPCNASVAPAKWERRRKACLRPEVAQVREARSLPIFWSRAQARSQATFNNERPFPASKFEPFARLAELPAPSSLASGIETWARAPW